MIIAGCEIIELLCDTHPILVYRGRKKNSEKTCIIKTLKAQNPSLEQINWLRQDYLITKRLKINGIIKPYEIKTYNNNVALIIEDFGGRSLKYRLEHEDFSLKETIYLAKKIIEIIKNIHQVPLIHRDINPNNIIINNERNIVKIADFIIASPPNKIRKNFAHFNLLQGSLPYIAPEQTGRINTIIDQRSDLYSFGVTFYEMLTKRLPFLEEEPTKLIYCHLAKEPIAPHLINPNIPIAISEIVSKLLAKTPKNRYKNAEEVQDKLELYLQSLGENTKLFELSSSQYQNISPKITVNKPYKNEIEKQINEIRQVAKVISNEQINVDIIDLFSVIKTSQAIAREFKLDKLIDKLLRVITETSGAQIAILVLEKENELVVKAEIKADIDQEQKVKIIEDIPLDNYPLSPHSIIRQAYHNKKTITSQNLTKQIEYTEDNYLRNKKPQSFICIPLINQKSVIGVLYLENNLINGLFAQERLEILNVICTQAAITIENAQLYQQVQNNEKRLKQFIEAMPIAIGIIDDKGEPYYANKMAEQLMGKGTIKGLKAEQISETYNIFKAESQELYPWDKLPIVRALMGETINTEDMEIHQGGLAGSREAVRIIPVEAWGAPIYDLQGNIAYGLVAFADITKRRKTEEALKLAEESYRSIFDNALEGIFRSTNDGQYIIVNTAMSKIHGYNSPEEMIALVKNIDKQIYVNPSDRLQFKKIIESAGKIKDFQYQVYKKDGHKIWVKENTRAIYNTQGKVMYYEGIIEDITFKKQEEEKLKDKLQKLEIYIDQQQRKQEVESILATDYFQELAQEAKKIQHESSH